MIQVTLVSLYGDKKSDLSTFIVQCQGTVKSALHSAFTPYDVRQVHATIIGLERRIGSPMQNANFWRYKSREATMDFDGFLCFLRGCAHFPIEVQLGGFGNRDYAFRSRNAVPYERSFSIQGDRVVVLGWPLRGHPFSAPPATTQECAQESRIYPLTLDDIRHAAQRFGILHSYHRALTDVDNDLFFRIGLVDPAALSSGAASSLEQEVREAFSRQPPLIVNITLDDLYTVAYDDDRLPLDSARAWSVADQTVTGEFIAGLYR